MYMMDRLFNEIASNYDSELNFIVQYEKSIYGGVYRSINVQSNKDTTHIEMLIDEVFGFYDYEMGNYQVVGRMFYKLNGKKQLIYHGDD